MTAGKRDRLITVERYATVTEDTFGGPVQEWAIYATAWAQVIYGTGAERRNTESRIAGNEGASQATTFRVLADATSLAVGVADRIVFDGDNWDIVNVAPLNRDGIEWTAIRRPT